MSNFEKIIPPKIGHLMAQVYESWMELYYQKTLREPTPGELDAHWDEMQDKIMDAELNEED